MSKKTTPQTKTEVFAEVKKIHKEVNALKKSLRKLRDKAKPTAVKAWRLGVTLEESGLFDYKEPWVGKLVDDLSYWQDLDRDINELIKSF